MMVKIKKDKKAEELLEKLKKGNLDLKEAVSSFPEPDTCLIDEDKEGEE